MGQVEIGVERAEFGYAQSGRKEEFEYRGVAQIFLFGAMGGLHEARELGRSDEIELALGKLRELNLLRRNGGDVAFPEEFEEGAQRNHVVILGATLHGPGSRTRLPVEPETEFADILLANVAHVPYVHLRKIAGEVVIVIFNGFDRPTAFDFDIFKELSFCRLSVHGESVASCVGWAGERGGFVITRHLHK